MLILLTNRARYVLLHLLEFDELLDKRYQWNSETIRRKLTGGKADDHKLEEIPTDWAQKVGWITKMRSVRKSLTAAPNLESRGTPPNNRTKHSKDGETPRNDVRKEEDGRIKGRPAPEKPVRVQSCYR